MITKNPLARLAYTYSGSPWFLWLLALTQTMVALLFLFPERHWTPASTWIGALSALFALYYFGSIIYYLTHRAQFAANPAKPIVYTWKMVAWIVAIVVALVIGFVLLELFVWRS
jgi:hypothetical protein